MDKAIQNCFDICPSSKRLGTGAVQSRAIYNGQTEEVIEIVVEVSLNFHSKLIII